MNSILRLESILYDFLALYLLTEKEVTITLKKSNLNNSLSQAINTIYLALVPITKNLFIYQVTDDAFCLLDNY